MADTLSILIVEDEAPLRRTYERALTRAGYTVHGASYVAEARDMLENQAVDLAFVDFDLPDGTGADLVEWAMTNKRINTPYCITSHASCKTAMTVARAGCVDVLEKPIGHRRLRSLVEQYSNANSADAEELEDWRRRHAPGILGDDPHLMGVLDVVRNVADAEATVMITGESGTGKELLARAVHDASGRRNRPFVALNCAAIPDSLIEAELFGHSRGAFTGAITAREGRIASADTGTLFLDEVGDMPLAAQAKLLRVLQEKYVLPIGANQPIPVDIRIVAATNKDLEKMVQDGTFRADLYYRLSVIPVHLPPLRERRSDIAVLAREFLREANERNGRSVTGFDAHAERALCDHAWPGNVRELMHKIERAVLLRGSGILRPDDLPLKASPRGTGEHQRVQFPTDGLDLRRAMDEVERQFIGEALERTNGNRTEAASLLGLNRTTLVEKIRKHGPPR